MCVYIYIYIYIFHLLHNVCTVKVGKRMGKWESHGNVNEIGDIVRIGMGMMLKSMEMRICNEISICDLIRNKF